MGVSQVNRGQHILTKIYRPLSQLLNIAVHLCISNILISSYVLDYQIKYPPKESGTSNHDFNLKIKSICKFGLSDRFCSCACVQMTEEPGGGGEQRRAHILVGVSNAAYWMQVFARPGMS